MRTEKLKVAVLLGVLFAGEEEHVLTKVRKARQASRIVCSTHVDRHGCRAVLGRRIGGEQSAEAIVQRDEPVGAVVIGRHIKRCHFRKTALHMV